MQTLFDFGIRAYFVNLRSGSKLKSVDNIYTEAETIDEKIPTKENS